MEVTLPTGKPLGKIFFNPDVTIKSQTDVTFAGGIKWAPNDKFSLGAVYKHKTKGAGDDRHHLLPRIRMSRNVSRDIFSISQSTTRGGWLTP